MRAPPEQVYDLVSDVRRIPEWSPECTHARWIGNSRTPEVGARFAARNRRGLLTWRTRPRVVAAERPREFAFVVPFPPYGDLSRWTYRIDPGDEPDTAEVTETFEMVRDLPGTLLLVERLLMLVPEREIDLQRNVETSLERLRQLVETSPTE